MDSAASAGMTSVKHIRDWAMGTEPDRWVSMGVHTAGN